MISKVNSFDHVFTLKDIDYIVRFRLSFVWNLLEDKAVGSMR